MHIINFIPFKNRRRNRNRSALVSHSCRGVAVDRHGLGQHSYSGTVISYLPVPKMKQPINNLEDLARSEDVGLILLADTVIEQQIKVRLGHFLSILIPFCYASAFV